jgi:hypothetical protein
VFEAGKNGMDMDEEKLAPEIRRWVHENVSGKRTVVIRLALSQDYQKAAETLGKLGMVMESSGSNVIVAVSDRGPVIEASRLSWVVKIDLPQRLDMKSRF